LVVSDYKTGRQAQLLELEQDPVAAGTKLQLPLYAMAVRSMRHETNAIVSRYWLTSSPRVAESLRCQLNEVLEKRTLEVIETITDGIEAGMFPGVPGEADLRDGRQTFPKCRTCDFDQLCPGDRDRRWDLARDAPQLGSVVALLDDPPPEHLDGLMRKAPLSDVAVPHAHAE